jgi:hypothetical protein
MFSTVGKHIKTMKTLINFMIKYKKIQVDPSFKEIKVEREEENNFVVLSFEEYYDLFAMGQSSTSQRLGVSLNTLFQTIRPDKLLFVHSQKIQFDRDLYKNSMFSVILSHTNYKPEGKTKFKEFYKDSMQPILKPGELKRLTTTELTLKYRWAKNE